MLGCLTGHLITHLTTSCLVSNLLFHDFSYSYKGKCHIYNQVYFRKLAVKIFPSKKNLYQVKIILNELTPAPGSQLEPKDFPSSSLSLDLLTSLFEPNALMETLHTLGQLYSELSILLTLLPALCLVFIFMIAFLYYFGMAWFQNYEIMF